MEKLTQKILASYSALDTVAACRPDPKTVARILEKLRILLFPGYFRTDGACGQLDSYIAMVLRQIIFELEGQMVPLMDGDCRAICYTFLEKIPQIRQAMELDLQAFLAGDPAAAGEDEIIVSYPGFYAIMVQRLAHTLWQLGVPVLPRMMTEQAHGATGIDIHPGAEIGRSFFIDHGTGVVIGETTVIGDHVKLYQGVTLGALSTRGGQSLRGKKRHPTIEDNVTIYANAAILGGTTVIGHDSIIGASAFITESVSPQTTVPGSHR